MSGVDVIKEDVVWTTAVDGFFRLDLIAEPDARAVLEHGGLIAVSTPPTLRFTGTALGRAGEDTPERVRIPVFDGYPLFHYAAHPVPGAHQR